MLEFYLTDEIKELGVSKVTLNNSVLSIFNGKSSTRCKFDKTAVDESFNDLTIQMISDGHFGDEKTVKKIVKLLTDTLSKSAEDKQQTNSRKKEKNESIAYKYSNRGKGPLREAVILAGKPVFLKYDSNSVEPITSVEIIEEDTRIIKPPHIENYPYDPIEFENMNEVISYLECARKETIDSLYKQSKQIAKNYNDQN
jgi:hypothetical protein